MEFATATDPISALCGTATGRERMLASTEGDLQRKFISDGPVGEYVDSHLTLASAPSRSRFRTVRELSIYLTFRLSASFVHREKFHVAVGTCDWRRHYPDLSQAILRSGGADCFNYARSLVWVSYDSTFAHFSATNFKLRLNERDEPCLFRHERNNCWKDFGG